jgi:hypothetical protein
MASRRWVILFCGFPGLMHAIYVILSRRGDDRCRDARRRLPASWVVAYIGSCTLCVEYSFGVATTGCGLPASCLVASRGSCILYLESWVGIATTGLSTPVVDLQASRLLTSLSSCTLYKESFVSVSTLEVDLWVSWRMASGCSLGLIWNWRRRCDYRCRDAQRRFDVS